MLRSVKRYGEQSVNEVALLLILHVVPDGHDDEKLAGQRRLGAAIRARRCDPKLGRMTALEVAKRAGLTQATMSWLESGHKRIQATTAVKLEPVLRWKPGACHKILEDPTADENTYADDPPSVIELFAVTAQMMLELGQQVRSTPSHDPAVSSAISQRLAVIKDQMMQAMKYDYDPELLSMVLKIDRFLTHEENTGSSPDGNV